MANKFLNVLINSVVTPVNIDDVVAVVATGHATNATTVAITYKSGKVATLTTPAGASSGGFSVANAPSVQRAFWSAIIKAQELPWNMVSYPAPGESFIVEVEPAASQSSTYGKQSAGGGANTLPAKSSSIVLAKDGGQIVFASIAIS